jgi:hypothetical protein
METARRVYLRKYNYVYFVTSFVGLYVLANVQCILLLEYFNADSEDDKYLNWSVGLVIVCFRRLSVDGTAVSKLVKRIIIRVVNYNLDLTYHIEFIF